MAILKYRTAKEIAEETRAIIESERDGAQRGLLCRWNQINRGQLKYWRFGYVNVLAGLSGSSKSYILNMLLDDFTNPLINDKFIGFKDLKVIHFGYEMKPTDEILRSTSTNLKLSYEHLLSASYDKQTREYNVITDQELVLIDEYLETIKKKSICYITDVGGLHDMRDTIQALHDKYPESKFVISLDHSLLTKRTIEKDELELIAETGRMAIEITKRWGDMVIILSQLNGNIETAMRIEKPQLHYPIRTDLHGSNQLFNAADNVIVFHKPSKLNIIEYGAKKLPATLAKGKFLLHGAWIKRRFGSGGNLWMIDNLEKGKIVETTIDDIRNLQINFD